MRSMPLRLNLILLGFALLLAAYPLFGETLFPEKHDFYIQKLTFIMILAIFAVSLDLLVGMAGMVSLAHAAFFGLAGYTLALAAPQYQASSLWIVLPASLTAAAAAALIIGLLTMRTKGIYFIMATLAFTQMVYFIFHDGDFSGGSDGMYLFFKPEVRIGEWVLLDLEQSTTFYLFVLGSLVVTYLTLRMLLRSAFGHVLVGIKENEERVRALGYNPVLYKLAGFVIAGTFAGLAGFLAAAQYGYVNPSLLGWHSSAHALIMVLLGGMGTLFGPILGAFAFEILHQVFAGWTQHWQLLMGAFVILVVLVLPRGLGGLLLKLTNTRPPAGEGRGHG
jgi:branched-chain amino acid transport system permease protein